MSTNAMIGTIALFAGNFAPIGYALCQGQILAIASNTALFSILGTTFGGNGTTTFALPDLRGRSPIGAGNGPGLSQIVLGEQAGAPLVSLLTSNLPAHNHPAACDNNTSGSATPGGGLPGLGGDRTKSLTLYSNAAPNAPISSIAAA